MSIFRTNLKKYLELKGVTQTALAEKLDISQSAVNEWINKGTTPRAKRLEEIAKILGITVNELLYDVHESNETATIGEDKIIVDKAKYEALEQEVLYLREIVDLKAQVKKLESPEEMSQSQNQG